MKLFDITLPDINLCSQPLLYYRANSCVKMAKNSLVIPKDQSVSFDTFFNCFSYYKYTKYTILTTLGISLTLKGDFELYLYQIKASAPDKKTFLKKDRFISETKKNFVIYIDIQSLNEEGFIYLQLVSKKEEGVFYKGNYFAQNAKDTSSTKIALIFCTYCREDYLYRNYNNITDYLNANPDIKDNFLIIVVDNGGTVDPNLIKDARVFKNKNLGGSGGFTRGIMEAEKDKQNTHFLLMDDDIVFDPKILRKTYSFVSLAKNSNKLAVGGAMLELDRPYYQYEMGGKSTGLRLLNMKSGQNAKTVECLAQNEREDNINYSAWWYMCMPIFATSKGLPLPLFIKGDDVEYGLRFEGDITVINGIAVWHESFSKKYSGELEYYVKRNELIFTSIYFPQVTVWQLMKKLIRAVGLRLVYQRYYEVDLLFKAYYDFLKGAKFLLETDALALHKELRGYCPTFLDDNELLANYNIAFDAKKYTSSVKNNQTKLMQYLTLNGYMIPKVFYKKEDKTSFRIIDVNNPKPINFYKAIKVLHYNKDTKKGFVTKLSKRKVFSSFFKIIKLYIMMIIGYKKARRSFIDNHAKLSSHEQWKKLLGID